MGGEGEGRGSYPPPNENPGYAYDCISDLLEEKGRGGEVTPPQRKSWIRL